jgi:hypothetical protein
MGSDAIIRCEKCNSDRIELIYQYINHLHAMPTAKTICANCGYPSNAMGFLSDGVALSDYVEYYSKKYPINYSIDEFKQRVVECVKRQIVQSCLFDEKDIIIDRKDGYHILN